MTRRSASHRQALRRTGNTTATQIARINELSQTARTTWFALLGYLAFVGVTLLGVEDADFFIDSRQTDLPLVGGAIPTSSFFKFAPILGAALYIYLHLHLRKLWEALHAPPPKPGAAPSTSKSTPGSSTTSSCAYAPTALPAPAPSTSSPASSPASSSGPPAPSC